MQTGPAPATSVEHGALTFCATASASELWMAILHSNDSDFFGYHMGQNKFIAMLAGLEPATTGLEPVALPTEQYNISVTHFDRPVSMCPSQPFKRYWVNINFDACRPSVVVQRSVASLTTLTVFNHKAQAS